MWLRGDRDEEGSRLVPVEIARLRLLLMVSNRMHSHDDRPGRGDARRAGRRFLGAALLAAAAACGNDSTSTGPPGQPVTASDNFERADGPLGPNWQVQNNNLTIESGEVSMVQVNGNVGATWIADSFGPDQFSELTVGTMNGGSITQFRGLQAFARIQPGGSARYGFHYYSGGGQYELKYDGVTPGVVLVSLTANPPVTGDVLRIEVVGSTLRGYLNGQLLLQTTHTQLTAGSPGFVIGLDPGATFRPRRAVASWRGGDL